MDWEVFYNSFREPDFIAGYEIQNRLGGGAFGDVYKARKHSIGKAYAIKFLKLDDGAQRDVIERELEQVRHFASIDHPNLVTIEDMGVVLDVPYLIMGYAGEDTLGRLLRRETLEPERALSYFVQTCRGVLALHDRRLVHFDLKPSNVFIKGEVARVGDYGLAKLMTDGCQTLSFGRGTPHYMAPEMLRNRADHRADLYSLGVILFESLAGRLPYPDVGSGLIVREEDVPPEFPFEFPVHLRPVVERCLRLEPEQRFESMGELLAALGQAARPGDSIVLTAVGGAGGPPPPMLLEDAESPGTPTSSELRQTASELARGAVEVARGVWDGLRAPRGSENGPEEGATIEQAVEHGVDATAATTAPPSELERDLGEEQARVVSMDTLGTGPAAPAEPPRRRRRLLPALRRSRGTVPDAARAAALPVAGGILTGLRPAETALAPGAAGLAERRAGGTVPVPPRSEGGLFGTITSSLVLGLEILLALLAGPIRQGLAGVGRAGDRVLRGVPGVLGGLLRLLLLLVFLTLVGAVLMWVFVSLLFGRVLIPTGL